jgi:hypothetical protein
MTQTPRGRNERSSLVLELAVAAALASDEYL